MKAIPLVDLKAQYGAIREEVHVAVETVMADGAFTLGETVRLFEEEYAAFCGTRSCVGVSSGTDALLFALKAVGIGPGAEVITAPTTYIATAEAIALAGAKVVFADVEPSTANIDPDRFEEAITERTAAVLPVHLFGRPCRMDRILEIANRRGLKVIEDCCQAHGAIYRGARVGTFGDAAAFSFYPAKNLGAYGDGGAVATNSEEITRKVRMLRDHGSSAKNVHAILGHTGRLDAIQAAVLRVKLKHLDAWNAGRRRAAKIYDTCLKGDPRIGLLDPEVDGEHVYHLYVVLVNSRDAVLESLKKSGIFAGVHYPLPIHLQGSFHYLGCGKGSFPVSETIAGRCLSLPLYPEITEGDIRNVCDVLKSEVS